MDGVAHAETPDQGCDLRDRGQGAAGAVLGFVQHRDIGVAQIGFQPIRLNQRLRVCGACGEQRRDERKACKAKYRLASVRGIFSIFFSYSGLYTGVRKFSATDLADHARGKRGWLPTRTWTGWIGRS
jgi:hypothetical protein